MRRSRIFSRPRPKVDKRFAKDVRLRWLSARASRVPVLEAEVNELRDERDATERELVAKEAECVDLEFDADEAKSQLEQLQHEQLMGSDEDESAMTGSDGGGVTELELAQQQLETMAEELEATQKELIETKEELEMAKEELAEVNKRAQIAEDAEEAGFLFLAREELAAIKYDNMVLVHMLSKQSVSALIK